LRTQQEKEVLVTRPLPDSALLTAWQQTLALFAGRPALFSVRRETLRTFGQIETEATLLAERFAEFRPRTVIGLQLGNHPAWPALVLALARRSLVPLPLGGHLERAELREALELCGAAALVTSEAGELRVTPATAGAPPVEADFLKLTSGTSGSARAIRFTAGALLADAENICDTMGFGADDLNYAAIPISHSYGFSNLITPLLCRGVPMALSEDRMPRALLAGLEATRATVFPGMPVLFDKLAGLETVPPLPHLRLCISAGAPLTASVATAFTAKYGRKIHTFYGSSECGGIAYDATEEARYEDGFLGTPMRRVAIRPLESRDEAAPIEVRSAAVGTSYFPQPEPAALGEGRFVPGDLVRWEARGLYLAGRVSDLINIAGRKLNPIEVETQIAAFPGLRQAVVFGVPSPLRGEEAVACVAGRQLDRAALQRFCHERLSQWQVPRDFWIVEEIPANERGKISRRALAEEYRARRV
jgi:long-chain acyl-CoA synthetase